MNLMNSTNSFHIKERGLVIVGNGIAGITAARMVRKLHPRIRIRIISMESDYFFSRTALMYIYMGHMRVQDTQPYEPSFYRKNRLELIRDQVMKVDSQKKQLELLNSSPIHYDILLLATGSNYNKFGWPGQDLPGVQGFYSLQDLYELEKNTTHNIEHAVIVGGGLIGIELAEMLHVRGIGLTFLVRENTYWGRILPKEESEMINNEIRSHHINLLLSTELKEILADEQGHVGQVITSKEEKIDCQLVGLTTGVHPNLSVLTGGKHNIETERGILVDRNMRTNVADIFSAGDCAQLRQSNNTPGGVEQLWYTGRMQGATAGRFIARRAYEQENEQEAAQEITDTPYDRGTLFNSAKFFTIEYQTYGDAPATVEEEQTFVWQDTEKKQLIRLLWHDDTPKSPIKGMNFLGTRYHQDLCSKWIEEKKSATYVAEHLNEAAFDPEFCSTLSHRSFLAAFRQRFSKQTKQVLTI